MGPAADIGFFASWYLIIACRALERLCVPVVAAVVLSIVLLGVVMGRGG